MVFSRAKKNEVAFRGQVEHYAGPVLDLCKYAVSSHQDKDFPSREFLNRLSGAATRLQELLDYHGAQHSEQWFPFREAIAAAKLFSTVNYAIRHTRGSLGRYELIDIESDCMSLTETVLSEMKDAIVRIGQGVLEQAAQCDVPVPDGPPAFQPRTDPEFEFRLELDRSIRHVETIGEAVVHLATQFLNLSEDRDVRAVLKEHECPDCADLIPDPISEESLRTVESRFHNLQSLYDTYIFETDVEQQNHDLPYLRGHISIIFHLTEIATNLVHYYVRHMSAMRRESGTDFRFPMEKDRLLELVFDYPIRFSRLYLESAVQLCQRMIQSYSVHAEIDVPIPYYRGFHVRPSTLIARIVAHYGSTVTMTLNGQEYNAALPLELFRANEEINAIKRRFIADLLCKDPSLDQQIPEEASERNRELQLLLVKLTNDNKIIMYDTELEVDESGEILESTIAEFAIRVIRHLVSVAKMDVRSDITVKFSGDNRALKDLEILANNGYGEDQIGNNIVLPEELSYLAR